MLIHHAPDIGELTRRVDKSRERLCAPYYGIGEVFQPASADWPGDKEGRVLLAFVSHYKMTGFLHPCMEPLLSQMPSHTGDKLYFGPTAGKVIFEQQLSGHSWLLRGLCEHYEQFGDDFSRRALWAVTEGLYLPTAGHYASYPVERTAPDKAGGVSGHTAGENDGWDISTDTGCAFMSIDGLSHVYKITRDARVKALLDEMIAVYTAIDKVALQAQTHCTLTAARGMLRMYDLTGETGYLDDAKAIFSLYVDGGGMDPVFQNLNWWGRPDTWTEPCAIVDSFMVAGELARITGEENYRRYATRIWHNGLATAQRPNGGAGTDDVVYADASGRPVCDTLKMQMYEAPFCCTMRLAEGLWYAWTHPELLNYETDETPEGCLVATRDAMGRYMSGDLVLAEVSLEGDVIAGGWTLPAPAVEVDGHRLQPLIRFCGLTDAVATALRQKILFS